MTTPSDQNANRYQVSNPNLHPFPETGLQKFVAHPLFKNTIIIVIILNAILLGALTFLERGSALERRLGLIDNFIIGFFVLEISLKIIAWRQRYFQYGWNLFDIAVVALSLVPASETFAVLRALRILRILRLLHVMPFMRRIVEALFRAIPAMSGIILVMILLVYVSAVIATNMFGVTDDPEVLTLFGDLPSSALSLFQVMTMDGWRFEVMQKVIDDGHPYAWVFFLTFLFLVSFAVLNLFIAVFVEALQVEHELEQESKLKALDLRTASGTSMREEILLRIKEMQQDISQLKAQTDQTRMREHADSMEPLSKPDTKSEKE